MLAQDTLTDGEPPDHSFRQALSPIARRACEIVGRIRDEEQRNVWTAGLDEQLAAEQGVNIYPGMAFTHAKQLMETTKLWRIVRRMPKGALLHAHCDAMVDFDYLFDVVLATPGMHIIGVDGPLPASTTAAQLEGPAGRCEFRFLERERTDAGPSIWDEGGGYTANTPVLLTHAADAFPHGGRAGFLAWLKARCTISPSDAVEHHHGVDHIWARFYACFATIGSIVHYEPVWRAFLRRLMAALRDDGVSWAEVRFAWPLDYCREGCETPEPDYSHMFSVLDEEIGRFRDQHADFWGLRMIWTAMRSQPRRRLVENMDFAISTKAAFPHLLAGFDLVGQEDLGRPLVDAAPELLWFRRQCADEGVEMPFFFHAGECLGDGSAADDNLFDAVLFGSRRIGHAFSLYKHPVLVGLVRDRRIAVESCPISNEVLRLCGGILSHPLPALIARGVPCTLSNDDPAVLGQGAEGMTHDFWQALQGWDNLGLAGLGSLAENSVRYAAFEDQSASEWARDIRDASLGSGVKAQRLKDWAVRWEQFCLWIVTTFGDDS